MNPIRQPRRGRPVGCCPSSLTSRNPLQLLLLLSLCTSGKRVYLRSCYVCKNCLNKKRSIPKRRLCRRHPDCPQTILGSLPKRVSLLTSTPKNKSSSNTQLSRICSTPQAMPILTMRSRAEFDLHPANSVLFSPPSTITARLWTYSRVRLHSTLLQYGGLLGWSWCWRKRTGSSLIGFWKHWRE